MVRAVPSRIVATLNPFSSLPWNNERIALFERLADLGILVLSTAHELGHREGAPGAIHHTGSR